MPADRQRQLTIDALITILLVRADYQPLLVVAEDLHWIDPSSLDLLTQLIEHVPRTRQLVVLSFRPEFKPPWPEGPELERLNLNRLDREASARIVTEIAGMPAPTELLDQLVEKADGVPLYLEELTKLVSEQGLIRHGNGRLDPARPRPALAIPATLADSLTARLDRLTDAKGVAQLGAAIGRQFSYELLAAVVRRRPRAWTRGRCGATWPGWSTLDCSSSNTTRAARPTPSNTPSSKTRPMGRCCGQHGSSITGTSRRR